MPSIATQFAGHAVLGGVAGAAGNTHVFSGGVALDAVVLAGAGVSEGVGSLVVQPEAKANVHDASNP